MKLINGIIKEQDYQKIKKALRKTNDYFTIEELTNIYKKSGEI